MSRDDNYLVKVEVVGDSTVGKSQILSRIIHDELNPNSQPTIGVEFATKIISNVSPKITLQIWDTAGREDFKPFHTEYYVNAAAVVIAYDITNRDSFNNAQQTWLNEAKQHTKPNTKFILVGTKSDLVDDNSANRQVSIEEAQTFANQNGLIFAGETSAKTGAGLRDEDTFMQAVRTAAAPKAAAAAETATAAAPKAAAAAAVAAAEAKSAAIAQSLFQKKINFIKEFSTYKRNQAAVTPNHNPFGFSKQDKFNAATKVMAYFYGAHNVQFSDDEFDALVQENSELRGTLKKSLGFADGTKVSLMKCFEQTREEAKIANRIPQKRCNQALVQFLTDYVAIRKTNPADYYFFKKVGCLKQDKIDAANKLIRRLSDSSNMEPFEPREIIALNDGTLKETIKTTLSWFKNTQSFDRFMMSYGAGPGHLKAARIKLANGVTDDSAVIKNS